jgi:hypothetical protein
MPVPKDTRLSDIPGMLTAKIAAYNAPGSRTATYNQPYQNYICAWEAGIGAKGSLAAWVAGGGAGRAMRCLLHDFGMDARKARLTPLEALQAALGAINSETLDWISRFSLPLDAPPRALVNPGTGANLSVELRATYDALARERAVTVSGGYIAASKAMHCLFPCLAPMIDGTHTGISYYNIDRSTYAPPLGLAGWDAWVGVTINGLARAEALGDRTSSWLRSA